MEGYMNITQSPDDTLFLIGDEDFLSKKQIVANPECVEGYDIYIAIPQKIQIPYEGTSKAILSLFVEVVADFLDRYF